MLYGGKTKTVTTTLSSIGADNAISKNEGAVNVAAAGLYDWLCQDQSVLRGLMRLMSSGGCYWSAYCSELTGRAAVHRSGGAISKADFLAAAVERLCKDGVAGANGDAAPELSSGLFG